MDFKIDIPDWLKIPINILLPAVWLFTGILLLGTDEWLVRFYLIDWRNEHGFMIGLGFVISSCLLMVYMLFALKKLLGTTIYNLTYKRKTLSRLMKMNDMEKAIIIKLYNSPGYTYQLDYNQPITQGLLARHYIYMGGQQQVTLDVYTNSIPANFTLQPFVYQTLDYYKDKLEKEIVKQKKRVEKAQKPDKKKKLQEELENMQDYFNYIYDGGRY